jgi:hypothetical protein
LKILSLDIYIQIYYKQHSKAEGVPPPLTSSGETLKKGKTAMNIQRPCVNPRQTGKLLGKVCELMPGLDKETTQWWIHNPNRITEVLSVFANVALTADEIHVELGTLSRDELPTELETGSGLIRNALALVELSTEQRSLTLVKLSGYQLGFDEEMTLDEAIERATRFGLRQCPEEVGPQLVGQYEQPKGEYLLVAMRPILLPIGGGHIFSLSNLPEGPAPCVGLMISGMGEGVRFDPGFMWVFVVPTRRRTVRDFKNLIIGLFGSHQKFIEHSEECPNFWVKLNRLGSRAMNRIEDVPDIDATSWLSDEEWTKLREELLKL